MVWYNVYSRGEAPEMQTDIHHLPKEKRLELEQLTEILGAMDEVEMVILYGSYARGGWREEKDLEPDRWSGHASDYDILVVTAEPTDASFEYDIRQIANAPGFSARVNPIVHDIEDINSQLGEGRYFFLDIKREGRMLYDSDKYCLAEPRELTAKEKQQLAQADFDCWYEQATGFYKTYEFCYGEGNLRLAAFNLNQATESAYKTIMLVFTSYCPHEHLLETLGYEAAKFAPVFREIFPDETEKERKRFTLLDRAYIGARYKKSFIVFYGDIDYLAPRVKKLLEITEKVCRKQIASMVLNE
jgi:uncharacterized protein